MEVLAVLTIASVVTIGGVGGYQAAMQRHQTNTILEGAAQRAIVVSQQAALDRDLDNITLGEFPTDAGRGASFPEKPKKLNDEFFSIPVGGLDEATCKQLQTMAGGALRRVDCNETNGSVTADLIYHKDLSETAGDLSGVKTDGSGSGNSATHAYDNNREGCNGAGYQYCADGTCITKEETCEGGSDLCNGTYPGTSEHNTGGQAGTVDGKTCRCPGSQAFNHNDKKCIVACSGHGTLDANEDCVCQGGYTGEICETQVDCGEHGTWTVDKCQCDSGWYGPLCDSNCNGFRDLYGDCWSCSDSVLETTKDECDKCATSSTPRFMDNDGYCWSCSVSNVVSNTSLEECDKCSNRAMDGNWCVLSTATCNTLYPEGGFRNNIGFCYSCSYVGATSTTKDECDQCATSSTPRFMGNDGSCWSCSYSSEISTTKDECDKCGNLRSMYGNHCHKRRQSLS